ncbi:MAG TPA: DUF362 domain-containing protein [bacterium]|nr:DUF362 domain-containing protein [bacterium]
MRRRHFIKYAGMSLLGISLAPYSKILQAQTSPEAVWVENGEPEQLLLAALNAFGGLNTFISRGDVVVIKPNIAWDRAPELAATTNPDLVAALVKQCLDAGAKEVKLFDRTCNSARRCYRSSQIEAKAKDAGADVELVRDFRFRDLRIAEGEEIKEWPVYPDYLEADKTINVPIAKVHSMSQVTLGLKNLMGVMGGERGSLHNHFATKLIDIDRELLPTLTIIDAYRVLEHNGPVGGNVNDVRQARTLIMSACVATADRLALDLFGIPVVQVGHIKEAYARGINKFDFDNLNLKKITLS